MGKGWGKDGERMGEAILSKSVYPVAVIFPYRSYLFFLFKLGSSVKRSQHVLLAIPVLKFEVVCKLQIPRAVNQICL